MKQDDIARAIKLSLIHRSEEEEEQLHNEVEKILGFVQQVQQMDVQDIPQKDKRCNIFREDVITVPGGMWKEKMLAQAPQRIKDWFATKKIL